MKPRYQSSDLSLAEVYQRERSLSSRERQRRGSYEEIVLPDTTVTIHRGLGVTYISEHIPGDELADMLYGSFAIIPTRMTAKEERMLEKLCREREKRELDDMFKSSRF